MGKGKKAARKARGEGNEQREAHATVEDIVAELEEASAHEATAAAKSGTTARKPRKEIVPRVPREQRNGVKRPGPGKCLEVWEYLDQYGDVPAKDLKPVAAEKGWNQSNALIELYQWRKFNGVMRTATTE